MNTNESKVMMFEKGRRTFYEFFIYIRNIDIVDNFKYLGITLFKNGNWYRSQNVFHNMLRTLYIIFLPSLIMLNFPFHKNVNYLTR